MNGKQLLKRTILIGSSFLLLCAGVAGCGKKNAENSASKSSGIVEKIKEEGKKVENVYKKSEKLNVSFDVQRMAEAGDRTVFFTSAFEDDGGIKKYAWQFMNPDRSMSEVFTFEGEKNGFVNLIAASEEGSLFLLEESYDEQTRKSTRQLIRVKENGEEEARKVLDFSMEEYISGMYFLNNTLLLVRESSVLLYDENLEKIGTAEAGFVQQTADVFQTEDKKVYLKYYGDRGSGIAELDLKNCSIISTDRFTGIALDSVGTLKFTEAYGLIGQDQNGLVKISTDTGEITSVLNFLDSGILHLMDYKILDEDSVLCMIWQPDEGNGHYFCIYDRVNPEEEQNKTIITLGTIWGADDAVRDRIIEYNQTSDRYRIRTVDYSQFATDDWTKAEQQFRFDVLTKTGPDIILLEGIQDPSQYVNQNAFEDLSPLAKKAGFDENGILENVKKAGEQNGKWMYAIPYFTIGAVQTKKEFLNANGTITIAELAELEKANHCEGKGIAVTPREQILFDSVWYGSEYIDWENKDCHFDSENFKNLLEFAGNYPAGEKADFSDFYGGSEGKVNAIKNNQCILLNYGFSSFRNYHLESAQFYDSEMALTGYPTVTGRSGGVLSSRGIFAVLSSSQEKEGAFDFIASLYDEEFQNGFAEEKINHYGFPATKDAFEKMAKISMQKRFYYDENGEKVYYEEEYYDERGPHPVPEMTSEEVEYVKEYISKCDSLTYWDSKIGEILSEETAPYFEGHKSADEVADIIQSRVKIYLNERQ